MNIDNSVHHTEIKQGEGSSAQVAGRDQVATGKVGGRTDGDHPWWVKVLIAACVVAALIAFGLVLLDKVDAGIGAGFGIAFLAAPGILITIRRRR